jgi:hypothetical protein
MILKHGNTYKNGRGDIRGPMDNRADGIFLDQFGVLYHPDGQQWDHHPQSTGNLVIELENVGQPAHIYLSDGRLVHQSTD